MQAFIASGTCSWPLALFPGARVKRLNSPLSRDFSRSESHIRDEAPLRLIFAENSDRTTISLVITLR